MAVASPRLAPILRPRAGWRIPHSVRVWPDLHRLAPVSLVGLATLFNLWVLRAETSAAMNVNDSAFHLAMIRWARYRIDQGHIPLDGWYPYLGLGFPLFHHYQSFPHLIAAYASVLVDPTVVFTWSLYLLLALWPVSVFLGARLLGWDRWTAGVAAIISPLLVSVTWYGFEHSSFTWRGLGMWSALWGMWLLPLAWGLSWRAATGKGSYALAALAVGLTVAFHFLTGYLALLAIGVWFFARPSLQRAARCAVIGIGAVLVASWVIVPLVSDSKWSQSSEYMQGTFWLDSYGAPKVLGWLFTGQLYDSGRFPMVSLLVGVGLVVCMSRFLRDERARALVGVWLLSLILFFGRPTLGPLLKLLPGSDDLLFHRYIMGVHLAGIVLAGVGGVWLARQAALLGGRFLPGLGRRLAIAGVALVALLGLAPAWLQVAAYDQADNQYIASQQLSDETDGADVAALLQRVAAIGDGRVYAGSAATWGHDYAIGSVPMYEVLLNHSMDGFGFTLRVNSLPSDSEVHFDERMPAQYDLFNLRYVILPADRQPAVPGTLIAVQGRHRLWQVQTTGYFDVVDSIGPPIAVDRFTIGRQMAGFLQSPELAKKQFPVIAYGGDPPAAPTLAPGASAPGSAGSVVAQTSSPADGIFRAEVVANRLAVVLLKTTYDPRWKVAVDGVDVQPEMVAPGMLAETVSPGRHSIEFRYVPYAWYVPLLLLGILTLVGLHFSRRALDTGLTRTSRLPLGLGAVPHTLRAPGALATLLRRVPRVSVSHRLLSAVAIVFLTAWAIRSLALTGNALLEGPYSSFLHKSPAIQPASGEPFAQSLLKINSAIPPRATVLVFWQANNLVSYGYFWSTFWLYPRAVTVSTNPADVLNPVADVVVQVRTAGQTPLNLTGFTVVSDDLSPGLAVTTYERSK